MSGLESFLSRNISGVHPRPSASPTFLQSACLAGKYWNIQENEAGPLSQCVVTVVFRGAPSIIFMTVLLLDVFRALEQPLVKAPLSFTFTTKLISIFVLFAGCFANTFCWLTMYKNEDYVVVSEESVEILQATAWLLSGLSLYLGYNRAREQSVNLRMYISVECFMSLLLLFLRPQGFKDNVLNDSKRPLYYIVLLDVIRVLSNLLLAFIMGYFPRDVPKYSDIVFNFKDNLLLEADGRGSKANSRSRSYGSTSKRTNAVDIRVSDGDREGFMFPSNINSNESNYFSDSTDGEEQFSPRTQENMKRIDMIKHALRTGNVEHAAV